MADPYRGRERAYWEERIGRKDRYSAVGVRSLPGTVNRYRKEAVFDVIAGAVDDLGIDLTGCRVLDAACGTGIYSEHYTSAGAHVVGVDLSGAALDVARRWVASGVFCVASLSRLPFPDEEFDLTHVFSVLYHVVDDRAWRAALGEIARVTRPGGVLLMRIEWVDETAWRAEHVRHRARSEYLRVLTEEERFVLEGVYPFPDLVRLRPLFAVVHRLLPDRISERLGSLVERFRLLEEHPNQRVVALRKE